MKERRGGWGIRFNFSRRNAMIMFLHRETILRRSIFSDHLVPISLPRLHQYGFPTASFIKSISSNLRDMIVVACPVVCYNQPL